MNEMLHHLCLSAGAQLKSLEYCKFSLIQLKSASLMLQQNKGMTDTSNKQYPFNLLQTQLQPFIEKESRQILCVRTYFFLKVVL